MNDLTGLPMGRPTITVVVDSFSGYIVGIHVSFWSAGLANALAAFKIAIRPKDFLTEHAGLTNKWLAYGIPDLIVVDNGLEFHSKHFHTAAMHLATDVLHCAVRQPWLKPMVERAIGEINGYLPTAGRVEKQLTNYLPENPDKTACITFGALCTGLLKAVALGEIRCHSVSQGRRQAHEAHLRCDHWLGRSLASTGESLLHRGVACAPRVEDLSVLEPASA